MSMISVLLENIDEIMYHFYGFYILIRVLHVCYDAGYCLLLIAFLFDTYCLLTSATTIAFSSLTD